MNERGGGPVWYGEVSRKCLLLMCDESKNVEELPARVKGLKAVLTPPPGETAFDPRGYGAVSTWLRGRTAGAFAVSGGGGVVRS